MDLGTLLQEMHTFLSAALQGCRTTVLERGSYRSISLNQLAYLETIHGLGKPTLSQVAARVGVSRASACVAVQHLVKQALIGKIRSSTDQRVQHICLSARGEALIHAEQTALLDFGLRMQRRLSDQEQAELELIFFKLRGDQRGQAPARQERRP